MMSLIATLMFLALMCVGLPIAASLGLAAGAVIFWYDLPLAVIAQRTVNSLDSTPLLAVPMFIFAACIFNTAGITQNLFDWIRMLVGRIRGGLGYVTILTHLVFSGISGAALADIGALGSIQIRMMRQQGYKDEFSAGICMAASTLGPIFPPSIPLVIYATTVEISAVRLMLAGIIPALVIAAVLMAQVWWIARREGLPVDTVEVTRASFMRQTMIALPAILAPVILIGGMMAGVLGSTEAAGITVVYAIAIGLFVYRKLNWTNFIEFRARNRPRLRQHPANRRRLGAVRLGAGDRPDSDARGAIPHWIVQQSVRPAADRERGPAPRRNHPRAPARDSAARPDHRTGPDAGRRRSGASRDRGGAQPDDRPADAPGRHESLHGQQHRPHSARACDGGCGAVHHFADNRAADRHVRPGVFDLAAGPGHEMTQTKRSPQ